jgi:metallopeptidase MepB
MGATPRHSSQLPPLFNATPTSLLSDAVALVETTKRLWDTLAATVTTQNATFDNTIIPIIQDSNEKSKTLRVLRFYASTSPSPDLRAASQQATSLFNDAEVDLFARQDMFFLVDTVVHSSSNDHLDVESRYFLERLHRKFLVNGCGITDPVVKDRFETRTKLLKDLVREANKNLHEDKCGLWLTPDELEGVPSRFIERLNKGEGDYHVQGQLWLPTKVPQSGPILSHAKLEATRKKVYYTIQNRMPANVDLFRQIVLLRDETARMLGYDNHAHRRIVDKMMKSPAQVNELLQQLRQELVPRGVQLAEEMLQLKKAESAAREGITDKLFLWDQSYYARFQDEAQRQPNTNISEYFELRTTLAKLLSMFEHLFSLTFHHVTPEQQQDLGHGEPLVWDSEVLMYSVWDQSAGPDPELLGYAYLDLYPRAGKYTHAGCYQLQYSFVGPAGVRFHPSSAVVLNYHKSGNLPTLLSLNEIRKLFHEIGHMVHSLCTKTKYADSHPVDKDFIEAPSLMFEQFFWQPKHIKDVSFHYSHISAEFKQLWEEEHPDAKLPDVQLDDETVSALARVNYRKNIRDQLKELFFATYDMLVHTPTSDEDLERTNLTELFNKTRTEITSLAGGEVDDGWEWGHGESVFRNIINGYDAGYYSYIL